MRQRRDTNRVIFHHSLSHDVSAKTIGEWHVARGFAGIGYHYVVRADGTIERGRDLSCVGAHAYGRNADSVGVCITGDFRTAEPTTAQVDACRKLYVQLCELYDKHLPIEFHRPEYHKQACPGKMLDRLYFMEHVYRGL